MGLSASTPLTNKQLPRDYTLPRDHPWATNFLTAAEATEATAWQKVWRDEELFEELGARDAKVLLEMDATCHFFDSADGGDTVSGACGHLSKGREFHWLCRTCQLLTTRDICCSKKSNVCDLVDAKKKQDGVLFKQVMRRRQNYIKGARDRGWPVKMLWLGNDPELRTTAVGRLAYAVGAGATELQEFLVTLQLLARELNIKDVKVKINKWRALGKQEGPGHRSPRTTYKITPVFVKNPGKYLDWLETQEDKTVVSLAAQPAAATTSRQLSARSKPAGFYKDTSDTSDVHSQLVPKKRPLRDDASEMSVHSKVFRSGLTSPGRRTPTPVRLTCSELNSIDDALVMRVPISNAELYRGGKWPSRLQLSANGELVEDTLARLQSSSHDSTLAALAQTGVMPVHAEVANMMVKGDTRRSQELERYEDVPVTANWGLMTPSAYSFDDPNSRFRVAPTRLPQRHLPGTPDVVEGTTFLPTTHAALCGMEELGRAGVLNASLLLHMIDEAESTVMATARANEVLTSKIAGETTAEQRGDQDAERMRELKAAATSSASSNVAASADAFTRLRNAARRIAANFVDTQQTAVYHRRWSLLQGGEREVMMRLLRDSSGIDVANILDVRRPHNPKQTETTPKLQHVTDSDTDGDTGTGAGMCNSMGSAVLASPVKLTLSDVESVLGVLRNVVSTPKSTTSSLSKIVNQVSGHVVSDFLSGFHCVEGEDELPTFNLTKLNLS